MSDAHAHYPLGGNEKKKKKKKLGPLHLLGNSHLGQPHRAFHSPTGSFQFRPCVQDVSVT